MDPRLILAEKLVLIGIETKLAGSIVLDAGSSQCVVNRVYLKECNIPNQLINESLDIVNSFYCGDLMEVH